MEGRGVDAIALSHLIIEVTTMIGALAALAHLAYDIYYATKHDQPLPPETVENGDDK